LQNLGKFYEILGILSSTSGNFHVIIVGTLGSSHFAARYVNAERRDLGRFCSETTATTNSGKPLTFIPMVGELQHILCGSSG